MIKQPTSGKTKPKMPSSKKGGSTMHKGTSGKSYPKGKMKKGY